MAQKKVPHELDPRCAQRTPVRRCRTGGLCIARADLDEATMALEVALRSNTREELGVPSGKLT